MSYRRTIRVADTDATGVLYFARLHQFGLEAFEEFLIQHGYSLQKMIEQGEPLLPIVHAEADYFAPLKVGDVVKLTLSFPHIGTSSFTHASEVFKGKEKVGAVSIIHVALCPKEKKSIPIPKNFKKIIANT